MRQKEVDIIPGYDGEYGRIKIFNFHEREQLLGQKSLFSVPQQKSATKTDLPSKAPSYQTSLVEPIEFPKTTQLKLFNPHQAFDIFSQLNDEQRRAVEYPGGPLLIVAGPGTGKTRTLTHRIAFLMMKKKVSDNQVLAVTFTNKAAREMRERLKGLMGYTRSQPLVATFHSFCYQILNEQNENPKDIIDDHHRGILIAEALAYVRKKGYRVSLKPKQILKRIIAAKQQILDPDEFEKLNAADTHKKIISDIFRTYQNMLSIQNL